MVFKKSMNAQLRVIANQTHQLLDAAAPEKIHCGLISFGDRDLGGLGL
jgi:hypothetical protein